MIATGSAVVVGVASVIAGLVITPWVRSLAHRVQLVAAPTADRWHTRPTALLGGVAIAGATLIGLGLWFAMSAVLSDGVVRPLTMPAAGVAVSALFMFAVGVLDDVVRLRPQLKFILQTLAGVGLVAAGATLGLTPWYVVNVLVTVFWFVALTNAFNLLDNMDGVAAGVGAIAATFLGVTFAAQGAVLHAVVAWALAGAAAGFLRYNFQPASIFMGDAGSLFLGSLLAGLVVTSPASASGSLVAVIFVPLAIVAVPVVDTALVAATRALAARSISQGGRDHSTHRLVALGLGERQVAVLLYVFAALGGCVGLLLMRLDVALGVVLGAAFLIALSLLAAYLGRLQVAYPDRPNAAKPVTVLATELLFKRRLAEMLLDVVLVTVAYYGAFRLRFEGGVPPAYMEAFEDSLGAVIGFKIALFGLLGVYRGAWRYVSVVDMYRIVGALALAAIALAGYVGWRVPVLATSNILFIDPLLAAALVLGARLSFKSLELVRTRLRRGGERVAIYGAGDAGEMAVRELLNNSALGLQPFCFLDDDARKHGARIHGVPVLGGLDSLALVVERHRVKRVLIGTKKLPPHQLLALRAFADTHQVELLRLDIGVRPFSENGAEPRVDAPVSAEEPRSSVVRPMAIARES